MLCVTVWFPTTDWVLTRNHSPSGGDRLMSAMEDLLLTPRLGVQKVAYKTNSFCTWDEIDS